MTLQSFFRDESKVIVYLATTKGMIYPSDISRDLMISRQRATSVLSAMEKKALLALCVTLRINVTCAG